MIPANGLVDTNILIDIYRGYEKATKWMTSNPTLALGIPSLVRMELVLGAQNKRDQERITSLIKPFPVVYPSEADAEYAMHHFELLYLSHQIEIIDCFIAAMSVRLHLPIYSRNVKDFSVFKDIKLVVPY